MNCPKWKIKYESIRKTLREVILSNMEFREQNEKMRKALEDLLEWHEDNSYRVNGHNRINTIIIQAKDSLTPSKGQN